MAAAPRPPLSQADPYRVLGVLETSSLDEIKRAYFTLVRAHPPERDPEGFKSIRAAYERLKTPEARLDTDMLRLMPWPEPPLSAPPLPEPVVVADEVIAAARALSDLARSDWREDFREVKL
jgi:curved DNA-binding protein CbpA